MNSVDERERTGSINVDNGRPVTATGLMSSMEFCASSLLVASSKFTDFQRKH
uniref:Uncharacterized protein n=1 Tax=Rhizophora mucronata TaxID=61149 RepID=A0A2P2K3G6_RHIMU